MLETTRRTTGFRDRPVHSIAALLRSRMHARQLQEVRLADDVTLIADRGHPNRCYSWTGELSWTVAAAVAALLRSGDTFLDIGSFCGQHAMRAARLVGPNGRVVAIEPDPRCLEWLHRNLAAAGLSRAVKVLPAAVVPEPGVDHIDLHLADISMSSLVPPTTGNWDIHRVRALHFDRLIEEVRPEVVKIDVEGLDAALVAASPQLRRSDAPVLIVELNDGVAVAARNAGYEIIDLRDFLSPQDKELYNVSPDILAYKPGSLVLSQFSRSFAFQLSRLRAKPRVRFL